MSVDIDALKQKQAQGLTVGVVPPSGGLAIRLEIDDFIQDTELANLYFLAMEAFMSQENAPNPFSYYEVSGIHGEPRRAWDNVSSVKFPPPKSSPFGFQASGYCAHGSVLFPTWHRVYLAQFEQALFLLAADIAPRLNAQAVLDRFRLPYWDPLLPRQRRPNGSGYIYGIPIIFTLKQIMVRRPEDPNAWVPMDNPLYQQNFPNDPKQPGIDWTTMAPSDNANVNDVVSQKTIRGFDGTSTEANHSFVVTTFDESFNPVTTTPRNSEEAGRLWRVMFDNKNYAAISNHTVPQNRLSQNPAYNQNSIEGFHDDIHGYLGKGPNSDGQFYPFGHMAYPAVAGFDPSFWMHHCNIDRIFAIWQGIHSNDPESQKWWTSLDNHDGTFVEPPGVPETPTTPLAPFRKAINGANVTWWTSNDCRDTRTLGYDYPQVAQARQSGNVVTGLRAWANAELGWADPNSAVRKPADQAALTTFVQKQIPGQVKCFPPPPQILLDGTTALPSGTDFISSQSNSGTGSASAPVESMSVDDDQPAVAKGGATQKILEAGVPTKSPSFKDRFGDLGDLVDKHRKMTQWNATFSVEKYTLDGPFFIHFFLGDFDGADDAVWLHEANRAGTSSIFANTKAVIDQGGCENCEQKRAEGFKYYDTVGLTPALLSYVRSQEVVNDLRVENLQAESVVPFLVRNLHWRVVNVNGADVPRETIPSLKVGIYSEVITLPEHLTDEPVFGDKQWQYRVTNGRPGGLNDGDHL